MPHNSPFSLPSFYLALACAGKEAGRGMVQNSGVVLFVNKNHLKYATQVANLHEHNLE
jgi:hypothetical protein